MRWPNYRISEWVLIGFFVYIVVLSPLFPSRPRLGLQPLLILLAVSAFLWLLSLLEHGVAARGIRIARDWAPLLLIFVAFREMELFLPPHYNLHFEEKWARWDQFLLVECHGRHLIESLGKVLPIYLELCYLLVYGVSSYCVGTLEARGTRGSVKRFWTIYLGGTLTAYALFPYFPSKPPRYAFPDIAPPTVVTWARHLNLFLLSKATIHSGVFPSAHVSSAFSAAWAMFLLMPKRKRIGWILLAYAISVSVATVYGRYHYSADVLAGFALSLIGACLCFIPARPVAV